MDANSVYDDLTDSELLSIVNPEDRDFFKEYFLDSDSDGEFLGFPSEVTEKQREKSQSCERELEVTATTDDDNISERSDQNSQLESSENVNITRAVFSGDSGDEEDPENFHFEEVAVAEVGAIDNPEDDVNLAEDRENGWSMSRDADVPQYSMPFDEEPRLNENISGESTPYSFLKFFLTDEVLDIIVRETNRYANDKLRRQGDMLGQFSRMRRWRNVNKDEISVFIALNIAMGLVQKSELSDYWSCKDVLNTPFFSSCMSRNRFEMINSNLHFSDNSSYHRRGHPLFDSLFKIRPVYDIITRRFREVYIPEQHLSLDEGMVPWRGPLSFRVYIPSKPDRFGLKAFSLNEAKSGYTVGYDLYTGSTFVPDPTADAYELTQNQTYQTVMGLVKRCNILNKGYRVYMDSYYMSPTLVDDLASYDTITVGTVRGNRKEMPKALKRKLKSGEVIWRRRGDVLALKWQDKRDVTILSSAHTAEWGVSSSHDREGNPVIKPTCVIDYNQHMGGTDLADQLVRYYPMLRRKNKWYIKFFFSLIGMAVTNAYILWKKFAPASKQTSHSRFRLSLVEEMVQSGTAAPVPVENPKARRSAGFSLRRLTERHFPSKMMPQSGAKKKNPARECVVCKERMKKDEHRILAYLQTHPNSKRIKHRESCYQCSKCDVGLCVTPCFEIYHTVKNFADVDPDTWSQ